MVEVDLKGCRVLVIEDEGQIAMLMTDLLEELGCVVVASEFRLQDARAKAATLRFDLALLDVNLNGEPSYPIAGDLAKRGIPFVLSTGYGAKGLPAEFGDAHVLQKPFSLADLERALKTALGSRPTSLD
ncbi:MAG TPA: response regulator [Rhodanobacteraceae bacterium]|nr:response regulator [Rhodanobacteraceae bacterium]